MAAIAIMAWGGHTLYKAGYTAAIAKQRTNEELIKVATEAMEVATAKAISTIEVRHVTIRQNLEKELTRDVVYRDCVASPRVLELTNQALTGGTDTAPNSVVPAAQPTH
jgi:hypothetical protein